MSRKTAALAIATVVLAGGAAAASVHGEPPAQTRSGLGDNPGLPTGTAWSLPAGVEVVEMRGMSDAGCSVPPGAKDFGQIGTGRAAVCVVMRNNNSHPVTVEPGEGLLILSSGDEYQHGVIVERYAITIEGDGVSDLTMCPHEEVVMTLAAYCLNHGRAFPEPDGTFSFGPISDLPELKAIAAASQGKDLSGVDSLLQGYLDDLGANHVTALQLTQLLAEIRAQPDLPPVKPRDCRERRG